MAFQPACPYTLQALLRDLQDHECAGRLVMFTHDPDYGDIKREIEAGKHANSERSVGSVDDHRN